jgi:Tfp pilus assembly protein PilF
MRWLPRPFRRATAALALCGLLATAPLAAQAVESEELPPGRTSAQEPLAPPPPPAAVPAQPAAPATSEAAAEERYLAGDLAGAAQLYRELAVAAAQPLERMRLLVAAAWLEHQLGRSDEAQELLRLGLAETPEFPFAAQNYDQPFVDLYVRARDRALQERRQRANELVQRSLVEIGADDLARARETLRQALALTPEDPYAQFNLALVEMRGGKREEAIAGFERLLAIAATRPDAVPAEVRAPALSSLGLLYYEKGFLDDSRRYLEQSTALDPRSVRAWNTLGLTLRRQGEAAAAEQAFRRALGLAPADPQPANNLGLLLIEAQRWGEAVGVLLQASGQNAADPSVWLNLGLAQRGNGDRAAAATALERTLALDAGNRLGLAARAASYLAIVRFEQGDTARAAASAAQALAWNANDIEAWVYQGLAQQLSGNATAARESFQRAVALDPARAEVHNNLGTALVVLDELDAAAAAFRQALVLRPGFAEAQGNLDEVLARQAAAAPGGGRSGGRATPAEERPRRRQPKNLGVRFSDEDFSYLGIKGAMVESVAGESPGQRGGLKKGDLVLGVDGKPIDGPQQLFAYIRNLDTGRDYVELDILRDGKPRRLRVEVY